MSSLQGAKNDNPGQWEDSIHFYKEIYQRGDNIPCMAYPGNNKKCQENHQLAGEFGFQRDRLSIGCNLSLLKFVEIRNLT